MREGALREGAAALPRGMGRLRNVRPANHPVRRLAGMARFLAASRGEGLTRGLAARPELADMMAWLAHEGIGEGRAREIAINVFVPFLVPGAWAQLADGPPPPSLPGLLERTDAAGVTTLRRYFGALRALKRHV